MMNNIINYNNQYKKVLTNITKVKFCKYIYIAQMSIYFYKELNKEIDLWNQVLKKIIQKL